MERGHRFGLRLHDLEKRIIMRHGAEMERDVGDGGCNSRACGESFSILTSEGDDSGRKSHIREDAIGVHGKEDGGPPLGLPANPFYANI